MKILWPSSAIVVNLLVLVSPIVKAGDSHMNDQRKPPSGGASGNAGASGLDARAGAEKHNALLKRGIDLIDPHIIIQDRKSGPGGSAETDLKEGIRYIDRAIEVFSKNWAAHWYRGKAYQALGDHRRAYESFHAAYQLNWTQVDVVRELGLECLDVGMFREAVAVAKANVQLAPKDAGVRANLALALLLDGQLDAAKAAVNEALRLDPEDRITQSLRDRIEDVRRGIRPPPKRISDL